MISDRGRISPEPITTIPYLRRVSRVCDISRCSMSAMQQPVLVGRSDASSFEIVTHILHRISELLLDKRCPDPPRL
jgi:hypothetical protein